MSRALLSRVLLIGGLLLLAISWWQREALPSPAALKRQLAQDPLQTPTAAEPFKTTVAGVTYAVKPLYDYELWGLVVSMHDTTTWWNWIHAASNDHLNVMDFCVVYGDNVKTGAYQDLTYSSGQFVCYVQANSGAAWQAFSMSALSNNHLLSDRPSLTSRLRSVRIGDQVRVRGVLAEYSHNHGFAFTRGTSTTRTDTGNGACETVYVQELEVLARGGGPWRVLYVAAWIILAAGVVLWITAPLRVR
jgi:hypothetical protein